MGNPALKKIGKRVLQIGLPLVIVAALLYKVVTSSAVESALSGLIHRALNVAF